MAGDGLRGIRSGTPVPSQERETRRAVNNVDVQNWGPERVKQYLEERYGANNNQAKSSSNPRIYTTWERREGMEMTSFVMSREQYLEERRGGKSRGKIAKEQGVTGAGLMYHLRKWGLADPVIEEVEMDKVNPTIKPRDEVKAAAEEVAPAIDVQMTYEKSVEPESAFIPPVDQLTNAIPIPENVETTSDADSDSEAVVHYITIRVPLAFEGWPQEVKDSPIKSVNRDTIVKSGAQMLQNAIAWAWKDLTDILGPGDYTEQVQQFIDRKLATVSE